ncbi:MAG: nicotinate phosphoribosyltransferase [Bacteroidia bacterium]
MPIRSLPSRALLTDLYQLTMAYGYFKSGMRDEEAVFHLFFRRHPFGGGYTLACGLQSVIDYLDELRFWEDDLLYLSHLQGSDGKPLFTADFLQYLRELRFTCDVDAVPEGSVVFPHEPLLRIRGPLIQCQLLETPLLNLINFQSLIATKAARICRLTGDEPVLEFGLRRAQGPDGALSASRAAYIGGCAATSNVLAGKLYGIPVRGTHAHSWVMSFDTEQEAFETYAAAMPNNSVFLVDTYDTLQGVRHAIEVGKALRQQGYRMGGIRLDSGDLLALSIEARALLDEADFADAAIVASNDLDEYEIARLKAGGSQINVWGVGTRLATAYDQPALGGVYKLAAIRRPGGVWRYRIKLSEQPIKVSNPGIQQVRRFSRAGVLVGDMIYDEETGWAADGFTSFDGVAVDIRDCDSVDLLVPVVRQGQLVYAAPALAQMRDDARQGMMALDAACLALDRPASYPTGLDSRLADRKRALMEALR